METAARCNIGACRLVNQDCIFSSDQPVGILPNLFIVADGMGGHAAGERASSETVDYCVKFVQNAWPTDTGELFYQMAEGANAYVHNLALANPELAGMGTTLVAASICEDAVYSIRMIIV